MASTIWSVFSWSRTKSRRRVVITRHSMAATRPPSARGTRRWQTIPFSEFASDRRTWPCWNGGNMSMIRLTVSVASVV